MRYVSVFLFILGVIGYQAACAPGVLSCAKEQKTAKSNTIAVCYDYDTAAWGTLRDDVQLPTVPSDFDWGRVPTRVNKGQDVVVYVAYSGDNPDVSVSFQDAEIYGNTDVKKALKPSAEGVVRTTATTPVCVRWATHQAENDRLTIQASGGGRSGEIPSIHIYGRWVFAVSEGFVGTTLIEPVFHAEEQGEAPNIVSILEEEGAQDNVRWLYPATLVHFFKTEPRDTQPCGTIGVIPGNNMTLLAGGSLLLGDENHIAISLGAAFGQVSRLNDDKTATHRVWRNGYFFGVSYRFR
jgi:hypothetical protein